MLWPRSAFPALPPATSASVPAAPVEKPGAGRAVPAGAEGPVPDADDAAFDWAWLLPPVRLGGNLSYDVRGTVADEQKTVQRAILATLKAGVDTYLWQPWFGRMGGVVNFTTTRTNSRNNDPGGVFEQDTSRSDSVIVTGSANLRLLPFSRYPFEMHVERSNSRLGSDLTLPTDQVTQRIGFSQSVVRQGGDLTIGYDHSMQDSASTGKGTQDQLQLNLSYNVDKHRMQLTGNRSDNRRERTGEYARQNSLMLQHAYAPDASISVDTVGNANTSEYLVDAAFSKAQVIQLSTQTMWRPADSPMTVAAGARAITMTSEGSAGLDSPGTARTARVNNANANAGISYDLTRTLHANASLNVNDTFGNNKEVIGTSQNVGISYQPDALKISEFSYNWSTSASASKRTGDTGRGRQLAVQLSHTLSRSIRASNKSTISADIGQSASLSKNSTSRDDPRSPTQYLTHNGSLSWNYSPEGANAMMRLSASDSRALDGNEEYFQMVNFQATSNLPTSSFSSWTGSLTIQGIRQGLRQDVPLGGVPTSSVPLDVMRRKNFDVTSTGSVTYQHTRMFGVRNLRYVSDLRVNAQALLPILNGSREQEMAAWDNRFDYSIGRTQLRVIALMARIKSPTLVRNADGTEDAGSSSRINKSIMFSVSRSFGDF
jgi:hypothetical protein